MDTSSPALKEGPEMPLESSERIPAKAKVDNEHPDVQNGAEATNVDSEWNTLLEAMTEHDAQLIQDWKDDLGNLLIFAGLFSGVVAGFALESYGQLAQDTSSPDLSVQLLAQISAQLASFSTSQGFVNSTVAPIPFSTLNTPSGPSELDIRINILWFLSLAVSLTASLLAIMVQQWLREYRLPGHVSIRERVRLRQYRFEAFEEWNVPQIVSTLPILLQVALILFLVGLCYLLASLDKTVAKVFIAFVGIALSGYFAITVLPIASRRCPYKNPLAHGIIQTVKITGIIQTVKITGITLLITLFCLAAIILFFIAVPLKLWSLISHTKMSHWLVDGFRGVSSILSWEPKLENAHFDLGGHQYWTARDLDALPNTEFLDRNALIWAPTGVSRENLVHMDRCLLVLPPNERIVCVCAWVAQALNLSKTSLDDAVDDASSAFDATTFAKIDNAFSDRFRHSLLAVMPNTLVYRKDRKEFYEPGVLVLLRHIARLKPADAAWISTYGRRLLDIRSSQPSVDLGNLTETSWTRLPTACLFDLGVMLQFEFTVEDISALFDYAVQTYEAVQTRPNRLIFLVTGLDMMLGSYATALHAVSRQPHLLEDPPLREKCQNLLGIVDLTVTKHADDIQLQGTFDPHYFSDGSLLVSTPAGNTLCKSIVTLAELNALPLDNTLSLPTLFEHLIGAFQGTPFEDGLKALEEFRSATRTVPPTGSELDTHPLGASPQKTGYQSSTDTIDKSASDGAGEGVTSGVAESYDPTVTSLPKFAA